MPVNRLRFLPALGLISGLLPLASGNADPLKDKERILFLGDSITHAGNYVVLLEAALRESHPKARFINIGLPSEGCTGLSEPAHPFPRPNVHERLDRALAKVKPDLVFACYGMNDGIYYPFSEERFAKYKAGIDTIIEKVGKHGAPLILLTPPPFDPLPLRKKGKLLPAEAPKFSWMQIYEHYDRDVIATYARWVLEQKDRVAQAIDLHTPIRKFVTKRRASDPDFMLSGDGVHLDQEGHRLIANAIHQALYDKPLPPLPAARIDLVGKQQEIMKFAWISHVGHKRPGVRAGLPVHEAEIKAALLAPPQPVD